MKKMIKNLMLVAVAAMAFVGCQNDNDEMNATARKVVLKFVAGFDEDTRATFGEKNGNTYPTYWDGNEWVSVTISDGAETTFNAWGRVELPEGEETSLTAKISVEFYLEEDQTLPAAGYITATVGDFDFETGEVMISDEQQPMENAPQSLPLISTREYTNANITGEPLAFKHAAAYGKMTIPQLASINTDKVVVSFNEGAYKYTIRTSNAGAEGTLWFACPAFDVTDFTVSFVESGVFSYTKSVESLAEGDLKFQVGRISAFTVTDIEKDELTPEIFEVFSTMEYLGDSTWKFSNANGYFMTIPFTTAIGDTLVDGVYTGVFESTEDEFEFNASNALFVYDDDTLVHTDKGTWVTSGGVITVETVDEQIIVSFIGYLYDPTTSSSFLYQGVYDPTFVPSAVEILNVSGDYYNPSIISNLWIDVAMSAGENYSIFLPLTVGEDGEPFAVIPEGVYTVGAETGKAIGAEAHANASSANPYVGLKEGTLTVSYVGEEYKLVLDLTNDNDEVFDLEWQGTIGGHFDWSNEFPHPGYVVTLDAPKNVVATVENRNSIVVTWDAVANAVSYTVSCPGQDDQVVDAESELTATFNGLDYETEYTITVVANAAADSIYADSEASTDTATTLAEQAAARNLTFTSARKTGGDLSSGYVGITFTTDAGDSFYLEYNMIDSTIGGTFSGSIGGFTPGTIYAAKLTPNGGETILALDGEVVVVDENPDFEFEMNFNLSDGSTLVATYEGEVEGVSVVEFDSAVAAFNGNWTNVTFSDAKGNTLLVPFGNGGVNYLNAGTWDFSYSYDYGYALNNVYYNVDTYIYSCQAVVAHVDGAYDITFTTSHGNYTFNGSIENLVVPGAEPQQLDTPTGLVATPDVNTVTVNWNAVANAESYDVTCGVNKLTVEGTTATFDGLEADATYEISVVAKADGYEDSPAATTTVTTLPAAVEPDSIVLTTITPLNETYDPGYYTWSFNFTDGTDNNKFAIAFFYNKASATSIVPGEYTFASELGQVNATNFALDGRNPYYFEGINKKLTTGSTVNVAVDGSVYTINMHFILSDGSEHNYKYVGEIVVEEPEPEPQQLDTPTGLKATPDVNEVTVSWSAVANAESYYVTCGDKSPQTVTTTTATFTDLTAGTEYTVTVVAKAEGYVDSLAASIPVTTKADAGGEAKQVSLTFFTDNGTSYIFKGNDGHNYLIAFRNFTPGTFSLTDSSKFITTGCTWTANNTTYFGGTQFAEGDTLELINLGGAYKIIIRATVAGEPVVATCDSTTFS